MQGGKCSFCMLPVIGDTDGVLEIDDPSRRLTENERAGMLLRALLQELGVAWTFTPDDDD